MRIRRKFLQLTKNTYPYGTESFLNSYLPAGYETDPWGNHFIIIGDRPSTMFTCHLDTACSYHSRVIHVQDDNFIRTDGNTILGADDKAGMTVMLYMIEKSVPGLYYFFLGEEVGCIGSGHLSDNWEETEFSEYIRKVVSFDRRGTTSVITHQYYGRCCSDDFANDLAYKLSNTGENIEFGPDDTGVLTDSAKFMRLVSECTNISVGYYNEHTTKEIQNINFLQKLCKAVCKIDWESLPVKRDPSEEEDIFDNFSSDEIFHEDFYSFFMHNGKSCKMYVALSHIQKEYKIISDWIDTFKYVGVKDIKWNGDKLHLEYDNGDYELIGNRYNLSKSITQLANVPFDKITLHIPTEYSII